MESSEIDAVIRHCDGAFENPVAQRTIYPTLLEKLYQKGTCIFAYNGKVLGYCAFYANDSDHRNAYISLLAVDPKCQKMHIRTKLLSDSFERMRVYGMMNCQLEVKKDNQNAIRFYEMNHFIMIEEQKESYLMRREL